MEISVSIPSSSGHQFTALHKTANRIAGKEMFQSLLHQGISLLASDHTTVCGQWDLVSIPSSSGHQFTGRWTPCAPPCAPRSVSIPSSSGHQFTETQAGVSTGRHVAVSIPSSSGHQFTERELAARSAAVLGRFNPFFIRASVYWEAIPPLQLARWKRFQSLLHQGISLLFAPVGSPTGRQGGSFNPFFIRASVYWKISWLHANAWPSSCVSIPSSSGHQFTEWQGYFADP